MGLLGMALWHIILFLVPVSYQIYCIMCYCNWMISSVCIYYVFVTSLYSFEINLIFFRSISTFITHSHCLSRNGTLSWSPRLKTISVSGQMRHNVQVLVRGCI